MTHSNDADVTSFNWGGEKYHFYLEWIGNHFLNSLTKNIDFQAMQSG